MACQPKTTDTASTASDSSNSDSTFYTKPYYFPIENLKEGKVYEYSLMQDSAAFVAHYWQLQSEQDATGETFLIWKRYNPLFEQDQYIQEWIIDDGVVTMDYALFIRDSESQTMERYVNEVEQNVVFPFHAALNADMVYRFSCTTKLPPNFITVHLVRDRRFSEQLVYPYAGKQLSAIAFSCQDAYDLEDEEEGGFWEPQAASVEVYAEGVGLVYIETKKAGETASEVIQLTNVYTLAEFEAHQARQSGLDGAQ